MSPNVRTIDDELWERAQRRRECDLHPDLDSDQRLLLPLALSLARLAAHRDARSELGHE